MARIRTIKPEFPQSEKMGRLSRDARLLFIQLWTLVDDEGRARAASRMLASLLYPYDDDVPSLIGGWLAELEANGCIQQYEVDGSHYLSITKWLKHQKIDHPAKSRIPAPLGTLGNPREPSRSLAPDLGPRTLDLGPTTTQANACVERAGAQRRRATRIGEDWKPSERNVTDATEMGFSALEVAKIAPRFRDYWTSKAGKDGVKLDWDATWRNWCRTEAEKLGRAPTLSSEVHSGPAVEWISREDPRWAILASIFSRERGKPPPADKNGGWQFPKDWLNAASSEAAE